MAEDQKPTLMELARLLDAPKREEPVDQALERTLLWLFRQIPEIEALWKELHKDPDDRPAMIELARLLVAVSGFASWPECEKTALWLLAHAPRTKELMADLETYYQDAEPAGKFGDHWRAAYEGNLSVDRLIEALESGQDWTNPSDLLDYRRSKGFDEGLLYRVCTARIARARGKEKASLEAVETRLRLYGIRAT